MPRCHHKWREARVRFRESPPPRWQKAEHKNERTRLRSMKRRSQLNVCDRNCDVSGFNACRFGHICFPGVNRLCQKDPFSAIDTLWVLKSRRSFWSRPKSSRDVLWCCVFVSHILIKWKCLDQHLSQRGRLTPSRIVTPDYQLLQLYEICSMFSSPPPLENRFSKKNSVVCVPSGEVLGCHMAERGVIQSSEVDTLL